MAGRTYTRGERVLRTRAFHNAADGNLDVLTYPSGSVITYHYDAAGQLVRLEWDGQPIASNIEYAPFGPPTAYQLANGIEHRRTHDSAGRINSYTLAGAVTDISYDTSGNIAQLTPRTDPGGLQSFQFDGAGRITRYVDTTLTETFTYDANANRTSRAKLEGGWQTTHYNYTPYSNRVTAIGGATLTHDAAGNRVTDVARGYTYNAAGRLTKVRAAGVTTRYEYNGLGERVYKYVDTGLTRHYAYDTAGHLIGEYDASGAPVAEYAWLGDLPVAMRATRTLPDNSSETTLYAIETDHLGTPRALTDPAGQLRWRWLSAPFGDTPPNANPTGLGAITFNLRFPGQYYDAESGLHYNYFRNYDPGTGRYVQSDPIGLDGGMNTYGYVGENPLSYRDPVGLWSTEAHDYFINEAFLGLLTENQIALIKAGSAFADNPFFQQSQFAYMHAMSSSALTKDESRRRMCAYIEKNLSLYRELVGAPDPVTRNSAYFQLGMALHAVMDSTSPAHRGFQKWRYRDSFNHGGNIPGFPSMEDVDTAKLFKDETLSLISRSMKGDIGGCGCQQ